MASELDKEAYGLLLGQRIGALQKQIEMLGTSPVMWVEPYSQHDLMNLRAAINAVLGVLDRYEAMGRL